MTTSNIEMDDPLHITPIPGAIDARVHLPGSKSITNRALILAALSKGKTELCGALFSRDTRIMLEALQRLGYAIRTDEASQRIEITSACPQIGMERATIDVGNAGTAARFLTAFLARKRGGRFEMDGDPAMRERPMSGLLDALEELGAADFQFHGEPGHFPFTLFAKGYSGGVAPVNAGASSQILSALLLSGATAEAGLTLRCPEVRPAYVAITMKMRESFGGKALQPDADGNYELGPLEYRSPGSYRIEPDVSAASYFLALALTQGGQLAIPNLGPDPIQGDAHFIEVLAHHGLRVDAKRDEWIARRSPSEEVLRGHREIDFRNFSDTFLTYAAISPLLGGSVRITGIGHTRHQETDRIAGMAAELSKLGQLVKEEDDALTIMPKPNELRSRALHARSSGRLLEVETYEDHRFAMSFGILASYDLLGDGQPWLAIQNPGCCGKTFPGFFEALEKIQYA